VAGKGLVKFLGLLRLPTSIVTLQEGLLGVLWSVSIAPMGMTHSLQDVSNQLPHFNWVWRSRVVYYPVAIIDVTFNGPEVCLIRPCSRKQRSKQC